MTTALFESISNSRAVKKGYPQLGVFKRLRNELNARHWEEKCVAGEPEEALEICILLNKEQDWIFLVYLDYLNAAFHLSTIYLTTPRQLSPEEVVDIPRVVFDIHTFSEADLFVQVLAAAKSALDQLGAEEFM